MEAWVAELQHGNVDAAWDLFVGRHRRLIFAAIRHYAQDYDDVMDVFAQVCQALREDGMRRLRSYTAATEHRAKFTTWLMTVVRHLTVDWFRHRDGRRRLSAVAEALPPLRRSIFEHVFLHKRSHVETYELMRGEGSVDLSFGQFLVEVSATYRAVTDERRGRILRELGGVALPLPEPEDPEDTLSEERQALEAVLRSLSAADRVALELFVIEEMPAEAVARVVGWANAKAVYNHVHRALAALRVQLRTHATHGRHISGKI